MDNHGAHTSEVVRRMMANKGIIRDFIPPTSSPLNPIETLWAIVRKKWINTCFEKMKVHWT